MNKQRGWLKKLLAGTMAVALTITNSVPASVFAEELEIAAESAAEEIPEEESVPEEAPAVIVAEETSVQEETHANNEDAADETEAGEISDNDQAESETAAETDSEEINNDQEEPTDQTEVDSEDERDFADQTEVNSEDERDAADQTEADSDETAVEEQEEAEPEEAAPEEERIGGAFTQEIGNYLITVETAEDALPAGSELEVSYIKEDAELAAVKEALIQAYAAQNADDFDARYGFDALEPVFVQGEEKTEVVPEGDVQVSVQIKQQPELSVDGTIRVSSIAPDAEQKLQAETVGENFSVDGIAKMNLSNLSALAVSWNRDETVEFKAESAKYQITATVKTGTVPYNAVLSVTELAENSAEYNDAKEAIVNDQDDVNTIEEFDENYGFAALDISFLVDGHEAEPDGAVNVSITMKELPEEADAQQLADSLEISHLKEEADGSVTVNTVADVANATDGTIDVSDDSAVAEFAVESFSVFTIKWENNGQTLPVKFIKTDVTGQTFYPEQEIEVRYDWDGTTGEPLTNITLYAGNDLKDANEGGTRPTGVQDFKIGATWFNAIFTDRYKPVTETEYSYSGTFIKYEDGTIKQINMDIWSPQENDDSVMPQGESKDKMYCSLKGGDLSATWTPNEYYSQVNAKFGSRGENQVLEVPEGAEIYASFTPPNNNLTTVGTVDSTALGFDLYMVDMGEEARNEITGSGYNMDTGETYQGVYSNTLKENGYPEARGINLEKYFGGATPANHLFIQSVYDDKDPDNKNAGYLYYSSDQYSASYNGADFTVYNQLVTPSKEGQFFYQRGNFLPYNEIDSSSVWNRNRYQENGAEYTGSRANEVLYGVEGGNVDYQFGMRGEGDFVYLPNGTLSNGQQMIFDFTGDDDMLVYIDGVLVLDLGGIHDAQTGSINFATGTVKASYINQPGNRQDYEDTSIAAMFAAAGEIWNPAPFSKHHLSFFYMERGGGASNLKLKIKLPFVKSSDLEFTKTDSDDRTKVVPGAEYTLTLASKTVNGTTTEITGGGSKTFTTGADGKIQITSDDIEEICGALVPAGETWTFDLKETSAPSGYQYDPKTYKIYAQTTTEDEKTYNFTITGEDGSSSLTGYEPKPDKSETKINDAATSAVSTADDGTKTYAALKKDDTITYQITFDNNTDGVTDVTITDAYDANTEFVSASYGGFTWETECESGTSGDITIGENNHIVTWTLKNVPTGKGFVYLTVKLTADALTTTQVTNGGESTSITIGDSPAVHVNKVENPVSISPEFAGAKTMVGEDLTANAFGFTVKDANGETIATGKNEAAANSEAAAIVWTKVDEKYPLYTSKNIGQEFTYTITEDALTQAQTDAGIKRDDSTYTVTVKVSQKADTEALELTYTYKKGSETADKAEFTNWNLYEPEKKEVGPDEGTGTLGTVKVGDEITYEIKYKNYRGSEATVKITDTLDPNVEFVSASDNGSLSNGVVTWTLTNVPKETEGTVSLTVKVKHSALQSDGKKVANGGEGTKVQVGNDEEVSVNTVENPVEEKTDPAKKETSPYQGTGTLESVHVGDKITYGISYRNYKSAAATIVIKDTLDENVEFVSADNEGALEDDTVEKGGTVIWTIENVPAQAEGTVSLTVKVLESALGPNGEAGNVLNGGSGTTVKVGNDAETSVNTVENPVYDTPEKKETSPYEGTGELGDLRVGSTVTYSIKYVNNDDQTATVTITDKLDDNVELDVSSLTDGGTLSGAVAKNLHDIDGNPIKANAGGTITWKIDNVAPGEVGTVTFTVHVLETALKKNGGPEKIVNGGDTTTVQAGNKPAVALEPVENPVVDFPSKTEVTPGEGVGVKPGDQITYQINYINPLTTEATVKIEDELDPNVKFVSATDGGTESNGTVTWEFKDLAAKTRGTVTLVVEVKDDMKEDGTVIIKNQAKEIVNNLSIKTNVVENPVPEDPTKTETAPYEGKGVLGGVNIGDEITYEISYKNYRKEAADVTIKDTLDENVAFVRANNDGELEDASVEQGGVVRWTLKDVEAGQAGTVSLTVKVLESALGENGKAGKVVNGGDSTTVQVGNDSEYSVEKVENPVYDTPEKKEISPYEGTGVLGDLRTGSMVTYEIKYVNDTDEEATVTITDKLDDNVALDLDSLDENGTLSGATEKNLKDVNGNPITASAGGTITWTIGKVAAGTIGTVTFTVHVLETALERKGDPGKIVNGGDTTTVKVGDNPAVSLEPVENPVVDYPNKTEVTPGEGVGVKPGDEITYEINYTNPLNEAATVTITDKLDPNVEFVSATDGGTNDNGVVTWTFEDAPSKTPGTVTLVVKVKADTKQDGTVTIRNKATETVNEFSIDTNVVENPVPENPTKTETKPYEGTGTLGGVKVGDQITYKISYRNYKDEAADVVIKDTLDKNVAYIASDTEAAIKDGVVVWTLKEVPAGQKGTVSLTVQVLPGALGPNGEAGKVVNGGESTTVKVGNDSEYSVNTVENPVYDKPEKTETFPYEGTGVLGNLRTGSTVTYEIKYVNDTDKEATVTITDKLDDNVELDVTSLTDGGTLAGAVVKDLHDVNGNAITANAGGTITWTIGNVPSGANGTVTFTVHVLETVLKKNGGPEKIVNGGDTTTVQVGDNPAVSLEPVENPVVDYPNKTEVTPGEGLGVKPGDEITYEINYFNPLTETADATITDTLDEHVEFVSTDNENYTLENGTVTWEIKEVPANTAGKLTLVVKVKADTEEDGTVTIKNQARETVNQFSIDTNVVENPVYEKPEKRETSPYEGTGVLGNVRTGSIVSYEIKYVNNTDKTADITIRDKLDDNVELDVKSLTDGGTLAGAVAKDDLHDVDGKPITANAGGEITWVIKDVPSGKTGTVTFTVQVLETALKKNNGPGKIVNGGDTTTVQVGNNPAVSLNPVENPVVSYPDKEEVTPGEDVGVKPGDEITYQINYINPETETATVKIVDELDDNVEFVSAEPSGKFAVENGVVTWTLPGIAPATPGSVTLVVKVKNDVKTDGSIIIKNQATEIVNEKHVDTNVVKNPVPENPTKKETAPYQGIGTLGGVKVGDEITYEISYRNYKETAADITIKDALDKNVTFVSANKGGALEDDTVKQGGTVIWTLKNVAAGDKGTVELTVKVLESALGPNGEEGKVVNGGKSTTVQVGNDSEYSVNTVENPVFEQPEKKETAPYQGTGVLGSLRVGSTVTYEIKYVNDTDKEADITITDKLDDNVELDTSSLADGGKLTGAVAKDLKDVDGNPITANAGGTITWTIRKVASGETGKVTFTVHVLETALKDKKGPGKIVNGGDTTTVQVGDDPAVSLEPVENPVVNYPNKTEVTPGEGVGVKPGDTITYEINYANPLNETADLTITDTLDPNVEFVSADNNGTEADGTVTWTIEDVPAKSFGTVTLTVKVKAGTKEDGSVTIENQATETVNDFTIKTNTVKNPVPEDPAKTETSPYEGTGTLGGVKVGDEITYEISYKNYKDEAADIAIKDTLDENVKLVSADQDGAEKDGVVTWTLKNVAAGQSGTVSLTVEVLKSALGPNGEPGEVVNGGDSTTVQVGNDSEYFVETVKNPVYDTSEKTEVSPYTGTGKLGNLRTGSTVTYRIKYVNDTDKEATVTVTDKLDDNVELVQASVTDGGVLSGAVEKNVHDVNGDPIKANAGGTITWTIEKVASGASGYVEFTVHVLETALKRLGGEDRIVNGGDSTTVQVGNNDAVSLKPVENPVVEYPSKVELTPGEGVGVKPGEEITYEINYINPLVVPATVTIEDTLDPNVEFVEASNGGKNENGTVTWSLENIPANTPGSVNLTVRVKDDANKDGSTVVRNKAKLIVNNLTIDTNTVKNPVPTDPTKKETAPYDGTGTLGTVHVDDEITYEISYENYKDEAADIVIKDTLDENVAFVSANENGAPVDAAAKQGGTVIWTLKGVEAGQSGTVSLTVKVLEDALEAAEVVNGGDSTTVKVGNDSEYSVNTVKNPVYDTPEKTEIFPYEGTGVLGNLRTGSTVTYSIKYVNDTDKEATVTIIDKLDDNVELDQATVTGGGVLSGAVPKDLKDVNGNAIKANAGGTITWTIEKVASGETGTVEFTVHVLETALELKDGPGKIVNGGDTTTVQVGDNPAVSLKPVENPVVNYPNKTEVTPGDGAGVKPGEEIVYQINYFNPLTETADATITDTLDKNVEFVSTDNENYKLENGTVTWEIKNVPANTAGVLTLTVKVKEDTKEDGTVVIRNKANETVNQFTIDTNTVENPVPEDPTKKETAPYTGTGELGSVKPGDEITYEIAYRNYKSVPADVVITDTLDEHVVYVSSDQECEYADGVITWTIKNVPADGKGTVSLTVEVQERALASKGGEGKVVNGGEGTTVQVGNDNAYTVNAVENPVPENPVKTETDPGEDAAVKADGEITYEISYRNYKQTAATIVIVDTLDPNVALVEAKDGVLSKDEQGNDIVTWTIKDVPAGTEGKVSLTVKVLEGALESKGGEGKVVNGGESTTVKVGNDSEYTVNTVENQVPENPVKTEVKPGEDVAVVEGEDIIYEISYKNYKQTAANIVIVDTLDPNVALVEANGGEAGKDEQGNDIVTWTLTDVPAGESGTVSLTVKVLEGALEVGKVVNGGESTTVKVGNDSEYTVNTVENPVPDKPVKTETTPGEDVAVTEGDEITYEITYRNYKQTASNVVIVDTLDPNVELVEAKDGESGKDEQGNDIITWTLTDVPAGESGKVSLTVKVLEGAVEAAKVVNGGESTTVKVGNDSAYTVNTVVNPVPENPVKTEVTPGENEEVKAGDEITYEISYKNYKQTAADIVIKDTLDENVMFVRADNDGTEEDGTVTWTLKDVEPETEGTVSLTVKVLYSAIEAEKVVNGGETTTVKVGNDSEYTVNTVENPVENPGPATQSLSVTKKLVLMDFEETSELAADDATFYVGLFADEDGTDLIETKPLHFVNASSETVAFDGLISDRTYYVKEVDENGVVQEAGQLDGVYYTALFEDGDAVTVKEDGSGRIDFMNAFVEIPDGFELFKDLTITKKVLGADGQPLNTDEVFYAGIFTDKELTTLADEESVAEAVVKLDPASGSTVSETRKISFAAAQSKTFYIAETDANGKPVDQYSFAYKVSIDKESVKLDPLSADEVEVTITNEKKAEVTTTPSAAVTPSPAPGEAAPVKTGDDTPIEAYAMLFLLAAIAAGTVPVMRRKRRNR